MRKLTRISTVELWFQQYHDQLFLMGFSRWHNGQLVDDAIQDVFLGLLKSERKKASSFDHVREPLAYLTACLNNQIIDNLEKERKASGDDDENDDWPEDGESEYGYCEMRREELGHLLESFRKLNILHPMIPLILSMKSQGCPGRTIDEELQFSRGYSDTLFSRFVKRVGQHHNK